MPSITMYASSIKKVHGKPAGLMVLQLAFAVGELYHLDLINSSKHYVVILDGIIPIANGFGLHTGIIGIISTLVFPVTIAKTSRIPYR